MRDRDDILLALLALTFNHGQPHALPHLRRPVIVPQVATLADDLRQPERPEAADAFHPWPHGELLGELGELTFERQPVRVQHGARFFEIHGGKVGEGDRAALDNSQWLVSLSRKDGAGDSESTGISGGVVPGSRVKAPPYRLDLQDEPIVRAQHILPRTVRLAD